MTSTKKRMNGLLSQWQNGSESCSQSEYWKLLLTIVGGVSWEVPYSLNKPEEYFCAELIILASLLSQSC